MRRTSTRAVICLGPTHIPPAAHGWSQEIAPSAPFRQVRRMARIFWRVTWGLPGPYRFASPSSDYAKRNRGVIEARNFWRRYPPLTAYAGRASARSKRRAVHPSHVPALRFKITICPNYRRNYTFRALPANGDPAVQLPLWPRAMLRYAILVDSWVPVNYALPIHRVRFIGRVSSHLHPAGPVMCDLRYPMYPPRAIGGANSKWRWRPPGYPDESPPDTLLDGRMGMES